MTGRLAVRAGIRHVVVAGPDTSGLGPCAVDVLAALVEARKLGASAGFLQPAASWPHALAQLTTDVPRRALTGPIGLWCRAHWRRASLTRRASAWRRDRARSVRRELARELRRHAGDERVPAGVRTRLKDAARVVGHPAPKPGAARFPRRLLRERVQVSLDRDARARADAEARAAGIPIDRPLVAFELPHRVENALPAVSFLVEHGYGVVRIGDPRGGHVEMPGLVDLACAPRPSALLEFFVLQSARFVVCESIDLQQAAYLTEHAHVDAQRTRSDLPVPGPARRRLHADARHRSRFGPRDPAARAPGRLVLPERPQRRTHPERPGDGGRGRSRDARGQLGGLARYRRAGWRFARPSRNRPRALAATVPLVADWGADDGFVGDGRLARVQAEALAAWSPEPGAWSRRASLSRVLFVMLHPGYVRYFESGIRALADAGHAVHVAFEISRDKLNESDVAARLATLTPLVTCGPAPDRTESVRDFLARGDRTATRSGQPRRRLTTETAWSSLATTVRLMEDYLRFFEPAFAAATALQARAEKRLPRFYRPFVRAAARAGAGSRRALASLLELSERVIPTSPAIDAFIQQPGPRSACS